MHKLIILFVIATCLCFTCKQPVDPYNKTPSKTYDLILSETDSARKKLANTYNQAQDKNAVIKEARSFIIAKMTQEILPSWYGTNWDFNGTTTTPKKGSIACGYFVTTTLEDAGFKIPRVKWAQMASEKMITSCTQSIKRFSGKEMEEVEKWLLAQEDALYIVGLDNHTGFVYKSGKEVRFIHSSPVTQCKGVANEKATDHNPLSVSGYRVFGKLFTDEMIKKWLLGTKF